MSFFKDVFLLGAITIFKWHLKSIYFFIKIFNKQKNNVFFLSRQSNEVPLNFKMLIEELDKRNIKYSIICKKVSTGINAMIRNEKKKRVSLKEIKLGVEYYFNLYSQMKQIASSKVIIIDGYNIVVSVLKHKKNTKIIQLWHALGAIKKFGYQSIGYKDGINKKIAIALCMHKNYDYVISGSKEMNLFFAHAFDVPIEKVKDIGTPSADYLLKENKSMVKKLFDKYPQLKKKTNILYSPTFRSDGTDNIEEVISAIDTEKYNLIITFHPKNNNYINKTNVICINREEFLTYDVLRVMDYVITDYSALTMDACLLNKKLLLYVYDYEKYEKENGLNIDLFKELKNCVYKNIKDIIKIIDNNQYDITSYNAFRKKYISQLDGNSTQKMMKLIEEAL